MGAAGRESLGELKSRCDRTRAAADNDPEATRRRAVVIGREPAATAGALAWCQAGLPGRRHPDDDPVLARRANRSAVWRRRRSLSDGTLLTEDGVYRLGRAAAQFQRL